MNPNPLSTVYATKRRRRSNKSTLRPTPKEPPGQTKSNPSKRHRERLNGELDHLASLLPFEQNILSKLDRLSILRLAVAFLRTKTYFQVAMHRDKDDLVHETHYRRDFVTYDQQLLDGDCFLHALNGFLMILDCNGELFFATHSIETYLGFHQSDVIHQSVYELVHSEDREELQRQLIWNTFLGNEDSGLSLQDLLQQENSQHLERSFTVRFRCLLDNTSGFLRLDIRGRIKVLHGQNKKSEEPPLALFCICTPFGPPSLLELPQKEVTFRSKHKLDYSFISMDQRGYEMLNYEESEISELGGYDLIHYDDLSYVSQAHQELLKTGACGMIAYRLLTKDLHWQWLQTSSKLVYKNSKPDFILSNHRPLMDEEGRDLLGKRTMDFKVTYLDAGLTSSYLSEGSDMPSGANSNGGTTSTHLPKSGGNKRYKTHLRDFLSNSGRGKRKSSAASNNHNNTSSVVSTLQTSSASPADIYSPTDIASVYGQSYPFATASTTVTESPLYLQQQQSPYQSIYAPTPATAVENRYFPPPAAEYLASYRTLTASYYSHHPTAADYAASQYSYFATGAGGGTGTDTSNSRVIYDPAAQLRPYFDSGTAVAAVAVDKVDSVTAAAAAAVAAAAATTTDCKPIYSNIVDKSAESEKEAKENSSQQHHTVKCEPLNSTPIMPSYGEQQNSSQ